MNEFLIELLILEIDLSQSATSPELPQSILISAAN